MYNTQQSPISNRDKYPFNTMNRSFMMDKKATFEEKYWVYAEQPQPELSVEDIVPPSLEEDPNQSSPLPPDVVNASSVDNLDEFIKQAEELAKHNEEPVAEDPIILNQTPELWASTMNEYSKKLEWYTVKELKEEYKNKWWIKDVSMNNNKKSLINLIIDTVINGTQEEENSWAEWDSTDWQNWSID